MFQVGNQVVYGVHGVCRILDIEIKCVDRQKVPYFVLEPLDQPGARFYIPTQKPAALAKLSPLLTRQELDTLLSEAFRQEDPWIEDENKRKLYYRDLIGSGDRKALVAMVHALHQHKQQQIASGKKFHLCDENFLRDAEKLLSSEFSLVLQIPAEQLPEYILTYV